MRYWESVEDKRKSVGPDTRGRDDGVRRNEKEGIRLDPTPSKPVNLRCDTQGQAIALRQFIRRVEQHLHVGEAYLFGSRARGDHHPDSDADLALVVDGKKPSNTLETRLKLADIAFDTMLETNILVQAHPFWRDEWNEPSKSDNALLIENVRKDGIRL